MRQVIRLAELVDSRPTQRAKERETQSSKLEAVGRSKAGRPSSDRSCEGERRERERGGEVLCGCVGGSAVPADWTLRGSVKARQSPGRGEADRGNGRACAPGPRKARKRRPKSSPAERSSQGRRPARGRLNGPEGPTQEQGKQK
ncbi:hypothetical protein B0H11DRAFT_1905728 [Mycena galericulata]|nr:hypothetical protein B0H11DRAFT_1905728 [Mycena galericulata]